MNIIQSPNELGHCVPNMLFLAGGISGCPDWQQDLCKRFGMLNSNLTVINPRRIGDLAKDSTDAREQILWEHKYLKASTHMLFWFPEETVCPITLFELGKYSPSLYGTNLFIGCHKNYSRRFDLEVQLPLIHPFIKIHDSLDELFSAVYDNFHRGD